MCVETLPVSVPNKHMQSGEQFTDCFSSRSLILRSFPTETTCEKSLEVKFHMYANIFGKILLMSRVTLGSLNQQIFNEIVLFSQWVFDNKASSLHNANLVVIEASITYYPRSKLKKYVIFKNFSLIIVLKFHAECVALI